MWVKQYHQVTNWMPTTRCGTRMRTQTGHYFDIDNLALVNDVISDHSVKCWSGFGTAIIFNLRSSSFQKASQKWSPIAMDRCEVTNSGSLRCWIVYATQCLSWRKCSFSRLRVWPRYPQWGNSKVQLLCLEVLSRAGRRPETTVGGDAIREFELVITADWSCVQSELSLMVFHSKILFPRRRQPNWIQRPSIPMLARKSISSWTWTVLKQKAVTSLPLVVAKSRITS
jgi:hypothetical protein